MGAGSSSRPPPADAAAADARRAPADAAAAGRSRRRRRPKTPPRRAARHRRKLDKWNDAHSIPRVKSPVDLLAKLLVIWLLFVIWVKSADWVNRDTQIFDLGYGKWNPILFFPFLAVLLLFAFPILIGFANFWVAVGVLVGVLPGDVRAVRRDAQQGGPAAREGVHARLVPLRDCAPGAAKSA